MTTPCCTTNNFARVADLVGLGGLLTGCNDSQLRDEALAMA